MCTCVYVFMCVCMYVFVCMSVSPRMLGWQGQASPFRTPDARPRLFPCERSLLPRQLRVPSISEMIPGNVVGKRLPQLSRLFFITMALGHYTGSVSQYQLPARSAGIRRIFQSWENISDVARVSRGAARQPRWVSGPAGRAGKTVWAILSLEPQLVTIHVGSCSDQGPRELWGR